MFKTPSYERGVLNGAAQELRRLHIRNTWLEAELVKESFRTASESNRADQMSKLHDTQAALNRDARNQLAQLTAQLEAIGAGGVESLRGAKPLTDKQIMELFEKHYSHDQPQGQYFVEIVRHAERAHKIGA